MRNEKEFKSKDIRECILLLCIFVFQLFVLHLESDNRNRGAEICDLTETQVPEGEHREETQCQEESLEDTVENPRPEYDFSAEEVTVIIEGISKEYTIAWVSDLHLISDHKAGTEMGDVHAEYLDAISKRYEELSVTEDGVHAEDLWPEIVKYLNYNEFDGVIFGGDIMDYCSNSNVAMIREGLEKLQIPYIYIRADHDYGVYYGGVFFTEAEARKLHQSNDGDEISYKLWDKNDFLVLGIDNSTKNMPSYYLDMVADVYSRGIPVIMATHVPYESMVDTSLEELSIQERNTIYYWSEESEHYKPGDITRRYLDMIYGEDTMAVQILAGHLHASWEGLISEQVPQHIFSPAYSGSIGVVHVRPY